MWPTVWLLRVEQLASMCHRKASLKDDALKSPWVQSKVWEVENDRRSKGTLRFLSGSTLHMWPFWCVPERYIWFKYIIVSISDCWDKKLWHCGDQECLLMYEKTCLRICCQSCKLLHFSEIYSCLFWDITVSGVQCSDLIFVYIAK